MIERGDLTADVRRALDGVIDPCSRFNGSHLSLMELGMVDAVASDEDGHVRVTLLLDDPNCLYLFDIRSEIAQAALEVRGVKDVTVDVRGDALWTVDRATETTRQKLAEWRMSRRSNLLTSPTPVEQSARG